MSKADISAAAANGDGSRSVGAQREAAGFQPLVVAGLVASGANLLSTVFVARLLVSVQYGALTKLLALFFVLSMPGMALMVGVVRRVTAWDASAMGERVATWMRRIHRVGLVSLAGVVVAVWLARQPIVDAMRLPGSTAMVEIVAAGGVWVLLAMDRGVLQSRRHYRVLATNLILEGTIRTAGMIVLAAGFGLQGAALGILLSEIVTIVHVRWALWRAEGDLRGGVVGALGDGTRTIVHSGRDLAADVAAATVSMGLLAVLQNADVVIFGSRSPGHSGVYAAISVPSKALVFVAILLVNYLLPETSIRYREGGHALRQLGYTLGIMAVPAVVLLGVAVVMPNRILGLVFGARYEAGAAGFSALVLSMMLLCVALVLSVYLLGTGWRWVVVPLAGGSAVLIVLCLLAGHSLVDTTHADLAAQGALSLTLTVATVWRHRQMVGSSSPARRALVLTPAESTTTLA